MGVTLLWRDASTRLRARIAARFVISGALLGLLVGLWEARLLYCVPSVRQFLVVDATYVIWFLTPLIDMALFGAIGAGLGLIAATGEIHRVRRRILLAAVLAGCAGAHIGWAAHFVHTHSVNFEVYDRFRDILFPLVRFGAALAGALLLAYCVRRQISPWFRTDRRWPLRTLAKALVMALGILAGGLIYYVWRPALGTMKVKANNLSVHRGPNIVLITMDTVRADHLSAYGYRRDTTPNLARIAEHGVLFENAISASSWTLPSLSSIYTGLLPHQSGANAFRPLNPGWKTIASVLRDHGYHTAGFNANYYYGESGWGLGRGFRTYDDDRTTLLYNLSRTLVGRTVVQPVFQNIDRYDAFFRRDAADLNQDIFRWLHNKPSGPYYLCINYFDVHSPYLAPAPYSHRFGRLSNAVVRRWSSKGGFRPKHPLPAADRAALIDGYDNSLAYLDAQIGRLVQYLDSSTAGKNTIIIITADHGEAFGEHGSYQHGNDLHREEIHVPLIVYGKGIPSGKRIEAPVAVRQLFATVIDLALGNQVPFRPYSLEKFWTEEADPAEPVVSELSSSPSGSHAGGISLVTAKWHYILKANGRQYLYDWAADADEQNNLSLLPQYQAVVQRLHERLRQIEANSAGPWIGTEYLSALGSSKLIADKGPSGGSEIPGEEVGAAQAYFHPVIKPDGPGLDNSEEDLLKTLPYQ